MSEEKISTSKMLQRLFKTRNIQRFIKHYSVQMDQTPLNVYIKQLCDNKNMVREHVIKKSGIERTYGHQIFNGTRKPTRDKVIQIALGFALDYNETQELLKTARKSLLHPKVGRDAVIIFAIQNNVAYEGIQATLEELNLPILGRYDE